MRLAFPSTGTLAALVVAACFAVTLTVTVGSVLPGWQGFDPVSLLFPRTGLRGTVEAPKGLRLQDEVWIVSDIHDLAAGIASDDAADRAPLQQQLRERQQRVHTAPLPEMAQAEHDLAGTLDKLLHLDDKYYQQLDSIPGENALARIPLDAAGHYRWFDDGSLGPDGTTRAHWLFSRATRADGRQYWAQRTFTLLKGRMRELDLRPADFISTQAILRPDLPPAEQAR